MRKAAMMAMLAALALPMTAAAQTPPDAAKLKAIEAKVPPQSWYPAGYYDIRIAAEAQIAATHRTKKELVFDWDDGGGRRYDIIDCSAEFTVAEGDMTLARYGDVALEISRIRFELELLGYPPGTYAEPLATYERQRVEEAARRSDAAVRIDAGIDPAPEAAEEFDDAEEVPAFEDSPDYKLAAAIEANRQRLAPKLPKVVVEGGCGAGEGGPVVVKTVPPGGAVLLVNAFAFNVCTRKIPDPWDRFKCKWNEVETGVERTNLSGRYVFQVRWPDGVVRKGTREIIPGEDGDPAVTVTFKKTGS